MSSIWTVRRSAHDAKLAGICGGVAEHWGIDPVLVRVGCVLLVLSGGVGVVLYLAGWLLIPVQGRSTSPADDLFGDAAHRWPKAFWVTLVVLACLAVSTVLGSSGHFGIWPALVIGAIWYFGFFQQRRTSPPPTSSAADVTASPPAVGPGVPPFVHHPGPPTPFTEAADRWRRRIEEHAEQTRMTAPTATVWPTVPTAQPSTTATQQPDPDLVERTAFLAAADPVGLYSDPAGATALQPPVRRRDSLAARRLRLLTVLVLGLVLGGLTLLDRSGVAVVPAAYAASALLVVGLALVAATWFGRARGLLPVGLLLVPVVAVTALAAAFGPVDEWSNSRVSYSRIAQLPTTPEDLGSGRVTVDLSDLQLTKDATYQAQLGVGRLEVIVPPKANVKLSYDVNYGAVDLFGTVHEAGVDLVELAPTNVAVSTGPTLNLDLAVRGGQLVVRQ